MANEFSNKWYNNLATSLTIFFIAGTELNILYTVYYFTKRNFHIIFITLYIYTIYIIIFLHCIIYILLRETYFHISIGTYFIT